MRLRISLCHLISVKLEFTTKVTTKSVELNSLLLSGIPLSTANISFDFSSNLKDLRLSGCNISEFPEFLRNGRNLEWLDLTNNKIKGQVPDWLWRLPALSTLDLSNNSLNNFNESFSSFPESQIDTLDLSLNAFQGPLFIPSRSLKYFLGFKNNFTGEIPRSICGLSYLWILDLSDNNLKPEYIDSPLQPFISVDYYTFLVLTSKGVSMEMERIYRDYTAIDFSGNQLQGQIPDSVGLLKELRNLNMSNNAFTSHIPSSMANLTNLESLDLSQNKISGEIPPELGTISSLAVINVSHNQLEGSIPQGTQFQRQQCSSYEGNPRLNRASFKDVCRDIKAPPQHEPLETKEEEEEEESLSWIAAGLGFGPGVVFGLVMGYIVTSYKHEWFMKTFERSKQQSTRTR